MSLQCHIIESRCPLTISKQTYTVAEIDKLAEKLTYGLAVCDTDGIYEVTIVRPIYAVAHFRRLNNTPIGTAKNVSRVYSNAVHKAYIDALLHEKRILQKTVVYKSDYPCPFHLDCLALRDCINIIHIAKRERLLGDYFDICEPGVEDPDTGLVPDIILRNSKTGSFAWVEVVDSHDCEKLKILKARCTIYEISVKVDINCNQWMDDESGLFMIYPRFSISDINTSLCGIKNFSFVRNLLINREYTLDTILPVGRYKGQTLHEVLKISPDYVNWMKDELRKDKSSFRGLFKLQELDNL